MTSKKYYLGLQSVDEVTIVYVSNGALVTVSGKDDRDNWETKKLVVNGPAALKDLVSTLYDIRQQ
jgi:hypothetical protein